MLAQLPTADPDPLWDLAREYLQDSRPEKMDLIVGVYRDEAGRTPVMRAVSVAESELSSRAPSKTYRGLSGNLHFIDGISRFLFGAGSSVLDRQCTIQTVGGTGALRLLAEFIAGVTPLSTVWVSNPGYVNHQPILAAAGIAVREFRWRENERGLDLDAALADLGQARPGDVLLIHGCCHNPSGIDPDPSQWRALSARCHQQEMIPFIDMAYQGFGRGVDEDAEGLRIMAAEHDCLLVAASCSKNMGL
ncbi:MAG TPA: aminotransferase class I/II-fold pyridoxal phosphate-dependent enzyme, partial [Haloferula sp.]